MGDSGPLDIEGLCERYGPMVLRRCRRLLRINKRLWTVRETKENLLDPIFLRKLERLRIQARRAFPGTMRGERRSTRRGASVEFRDFRKYEPGDDFRHIDWSIFARLERLMLRQFVEEEDVRIPPATAKCSTVRR